jgi:uncharacterized repeat protein (TIGR02543 family)
MTPNNMVMEYNTILAPPAISTTGNGGIFYQPPNEAIFRYNIIDSSLKGQHQGLVPVVGSNWAARQSLEVGTQFGIRNNYIIKWNSAQAVAWPSSAIDYVTESGRNNIIYNNWAAYVSDTNKEAWGSDIDPDNFWVSFNCDTNYYDVDFDILDQEGIPVTNATITFAGITNLQGNYSFTNIEEGSYSYTVQATGFQTLNQGGLQINSDLVEIVNLQPSIHQVNLITTPVGSGLTTGAGSYPYGQTANITASAKEGNTFTNWTENGNVISHNASYSFTATQNRSLTANFSAEAYAISLSASPAAGGTITGAGNYSNGQSATVSATASAGYTLSNWTENGSVVSNSASYTFTVSQNRNLTANFTANTYTIALNASPTNGGTTSGGGTFNHGQSVTITAAPSSGYFFTNWTENGNVVSNNANYTFSVTQNQSLTANFTAYTYNIALNASPANGGTTAGGGTFNQGQSATITASAAAGYAFTNWTENGNVVSNNASYTFNVTQNRSLSANFTANTYTVVLNVGPAGGGITAGGGTFSHGQSVTVTAAPEQGFVFNGWFEDGNMVSNQETYTFTITHNRTLTANFEREMFVLTYLTDSNGEIVGNPEQAVYYSENGEPVHAVPLEGHHFVRWCDQLSFNPRTELFVTQNITRTAIFAKNVYHLSYGADKNGIVLGETDQFIEYGDNALPVQALPLSGYRFIGWSDGTYDNPRIDFDVNSDLQVFAMFDIEIEIDEHGIQDILVYPIPTKNVLNVEIPFAEEFEVHLFDMQGRLINTLTNAVQGSQSYNLSWLSPGVYYLNFVSPTGMLTRRIVKGR